MLKSARKAVAAAPPVLVTANGREFPLLDPSPADIDFNVIGESLAKQCRFGGHTTQFYSAAQHAITVAEMLPPEWQLYGLLHKAHEAFLGDIAAPVQRAIELQTGSDALRGVIVAIDAAVHGAAGLDWPLPAEIAAAVAQAERVALATELRDLMPQTRADRGTLPPPLRRVLRPMPWATAMEAFHLRFHEYARWHAAPRAGAFGA